MSEYWETHEVNTLVKMWKDGVIIPKIAAALGRTTRGIDRKAQQLKKAGTILPRKRRWTVSRKWRPSDDDKIIAGARQGLTNRMIADDMGATYREVFKRAWRLEKSGRMAVSVPNPILRDDDKRVTFNRVLAFVCSTCRVSPESVLGVRKSGDIVRARQVLIAVARRNTKLSYPQIGERLNRDHSTIMHGHRVAEAKYQDAIAAVESKMFSALEAAA